jgi:hypothetical protein
MDLDNSNINNIIPPEILSLIIKKENNSVCKLWYNVWLQHTSTLIMTSVWDSDFKYLLQLPSLVNLTIDQGKYPGNFGVGYNYTKFDETATKLILPRLQQFHFNWNININDNILQLMTNLTKLDIDINYCKSNGDCLSVLTNLKILRFGGNIPIDGSLKQLNKLEHLELDFNSYVSDNSFETLTNLKILNIKCTGNNLTNNLTNNFAIYLTNLNKLTINGYSGCNINDIIFEYLTNLTCLKLDDMPQITGSGLKYLTNLIHLNFDTKRSIKTGLIFLTNLKSLYLPCKDTNIQSEVATLTSLTRLYSLSNNAITDNMISNLFNLRSLGLYGAIKVTDESIQRLTNLTRLNISHNKVITDEGIKLLTKLRDLNLKNNVKITDQGISKLTNLISLNLRTNSKITDNSVSLLTKLEILNLYNNKIVTNTCLNNLDNLRILKVNPGHNYVPKYNVTVNDTRNYESDSDDQLMTFSSDESDDEIWLSDSD